MRKYITLNYTSSFVWLLLLIATAARPTAANAQKQNNQWRFGVGGAINFNTNPPNSPGGSLTNTNEGSASVADRNTGALLFYTDGVTIWNANNAVMQNGSGLLGGVSLLSSTSAAVIVPKPLSNTIYYVFTIDEQSSTNGLNYSVVDMSLNGGLGAVVPGQKNIFLYSTTSEKLHAVPSADGCGYWLITHDLPGNTFIAFKITSTGVLPTPVTSSVGATQGNGAGHLKVNSQFNKLAMGNFFSGEIELFDFDNATGVVSNPVVWSYTLPNGSAIYGLEFSPGGQYLYVSNLERVVQYDISSGIGSQIAASIVNITPSFNALNQPATLQKGPDNKIYVAASPLSVINDPDKAGTACNFQQNPFSLNGGTAQYGLPQYIYTLFTKTNNITYADTCANSPTSFGIANTTDVQSVTWNFGDPASGSNNTATGLQTAHTFTTPGVYNVRSIVVYPCYSDTLFQTVNILNCTVTVTGIKFIGDPCNDLTFAFQATGVSSSPYFFWNFGDPASGTNDTTTILGGSANPFPTHTFTSTGVYNVCVSYQEPGWPVATVCRTIVVGLCCNGIVKAVDSCAQSNTSFTLTTAATINSVLWNFDDPTSGSNNTSTQLNPTHQFSAPGTYQVAVTVNATCGTFTINYPITIVNCGAVCDTAAITGTQNLCNRQTTQLTPSFTGGTWSSSNAALATISSTGLVTAAGTGTVVFTYNLNRSCGPTVSRFTIIITDTIALTPINGSNTVCSGGTLPLQISNSGGTWSSSNTGIATVSNTGIVTGIAAGTTVITYSVSNSCGTSIQRKTITVTNAPARPGINGVASLCVNAPATFTTTVGGGTWSSSNTTIATVSNAGVVTPSSAGSAIILYTLSSSCGTVTDSFSVLVNDTLPSVNVSGDTIVCTGNTIALSASLPNGSWTSSNTTVATVSATGTVTGASVGSAVITYQVANSCSIRRDAVTITVTGPAAAPVISGTSRLCLADSTTLQVVNAAPNGSWTSLNPAIATVDSIGLVRTYLPGTATFVYAKPAPCGQLSDTFRLTVFSVPDITAPRTYFVEKGSSITLNGTLATAGTWAYLWQSGTYLNSDTISTPLCTPLSDIKYTLTVANSGYTNCRDTQHISVFIIPERIELPNVFSPNADGVNDTWNLKALKAFPNVEVNIFTRWGAQVFNSVGYNQPWDGTYRGKPMPVGTYYYVIRPGLGRGTLSGWVTLLR